jgi:hypothetical protein
MHQHVKNTFRTLLTATALAGAVHGAQAVEVVFENGFLLDESTFNQWVYGNIRSGVVAESEIAVAVESIDRACQLTETQEEKLRLAARGDYARFKQRVEVMREKYAGKMHDQNDVGRIHQEIHPLNVTYQAGLLGPTSLFAKSLRGILTPEQLKKYTANEAARIQSRHDAKISLFVAVLERRCPLTDEQRTALVKLLRDETRPPKRPSQLDQYVILVQADRIADEKFSDILDDEQCRVLERMIAQARNLEPHLRQQGVLP